MGAENFSSLNLTGCFVKATAQKKSGSVLPKGIALPLALLYNLIVKKKPTGKQGYYTARRGRNQAVLPLIVVGEK